MAASAITLPLCSNPPSNSNPTSLSLSLSLSPSSSLFFSSSIKNRVALALDRPITAHKRSFSCNALFGLGVPELVVIVGVSALVFGPKQLPEVGRTIGKTVKSFQQAAKEFETELRKEGEASAEPSDEKVKTVVELEQQQEEAKVSITNETS